MSARAQTTSVDGFSQRYLGWQVFSSLLPRVFSILGLIRPPSIRWLPIINHTPSVIHLYHRNLYSLLSSAFPSSALGRVEPVAGSGPAVQEYPIPRSFLVGAVVCVILSLFFSGERAMFLGLMG